MVVPFPGRGFPRRLDGRRAQPCCRSEPESGGEPSPPLSLGCGIGRTGLRLVWSRSRPRGSQAGERRSVCGISGRHGAWQRHARRCGRKARAMRPVLCY